MFSKHFSTRGKQTNSNKNVLFIYFKGFIKGAESIPVLISIPLTGFLNDASLTHAGYYICSVLVAISGVLMCFIGERKDTPPKYSMNG